MGIKELSEEVVTLGLYTLKAERGYVCYNSYTNHYFIGKKKHSEVFSFITPRMLTRECMLDYHCKLSKVWNLFPTAKLVQHKH